MVLLIKRKMIPKRTAKINAKIRRRAKNDKRKPNRKTSKLII